MPLTLDDNLIKAIGMDEQALRIEIACRLFEAGKVSLKTAGDIAGLHRLAMEDELIARKIPIYILTVEELDKDLQTLDRMGV